MSSNNYMLIRKYKSVYHLTMEDVDEDVVRPVDEATVYLMSCDLEAVLEEAELYGTEYGIHYEKDGR